MSREQAIQIGKTDTHVVLRIGPWTLWHAIQKDARFPRVEDAIPGPETATTSLQVDPEDARFVEAALERLPGADALHGPMTIDCNGKVALRVYPERQFEPTISIGTGVHPFGYVPILRCVSPTEPI